MPIFLPDYSNGIEAGFDSMISPRWQSEHLIFWFFMIIPCIFFLACSSFASLGDDSNGNDNDNDDNEESPDGSLGLVAKQHVWSALKDISPHMVRQIGW